MLKNLIFIVIAAAIVAGAYIGVDAFFKDDEVEGGGRPPSMPARVESAEAVRQPIRETITFPGSVAASETVSITPKITGLITGIFVEMGDYVNAGHPLVSIDDSEYVERLKQAEANLRLAEAQARRTKTGYELTEREFERATRSGKEGISSQRELDNATANLESASAEVDVSLAEVERMRAVMEEAQLNVSNTAIHAPVSGWVQERPVDAGALATPSSAILTLVDMDPAEVVVYLPEREIELAESGRDVIVSLNRGNLNFEGKVSRVSPSLRANTRTAEVVIDVPNPETRLKPGMSADVTFVAQVDDNALVIPDTAIVFQNNRSEVYRIDNGKAIAVPVTTGIQDQGLIQILDGISEGDRVVVKGQFMIKDGDDVDDGTMPPRRPAGPGTDS